MTAFPPFPTGDCRLINASVPLCLLDARDGGDVQSEALALCRRHNHRRKDPPTGRRRSRRHVYR